MVEMNEISKDTQKSMKTRIITGIIMALVGVPCVILGDWFYLIAIFFIVGIGLSEVIKTTGNKYPPLVVALLYIFTYLLCGYSCQDWKLIVLGLGNLFVFDQNIEVAKMRKYVN